MKTGKNKSTYQRPQGHAGNRKALTLLAFRRFSSVQRIDSLCVICSYTRSDAREMSDTLEMTTDSIQPVPGAENDPNEDGESVATTNLYWEDSGLPLELQKGMENLRVNGELTDVTLNVQGQDFPCHRAVLAASSHYFRLKKHIFSNL